MFRLSVHTGLLAYANMEFIITHQLNNLNEVVYTKTATEI